MGDLHYGDAAARVVSGRIAAKCADATAVQAIPVTDREDGMLVMKMDDDTPWLFDAASSAGASASVLVPAAGTGRWLALVSGITAALAATTPAAVAAAGDAGSAATASKSDHAHADPLRAVKGTDVADSSVTIAMAQGLWRKLQAATLSANRSTALSMTGAVAGSEMILTRLDLGAFTWTITDAGPGTPTLFVFPAGSVGSIKVQSDGTNWFVKQAGMQHPAATTALPGTMSAADKKFLDGVHSAKGANLTDAPATLDISQGTWRIMPAATLSADRAFTLSPTVGTPLAGDQIVITRLDAGAHAMTIIDGGAGTPTLMTMPNSKTAWIKAQFDGTNWFMKEFGVDSAA